MKLAIVAVFVFMLLIHQDFWSWGSDELVFGYMPVGLFYHALFSIFCAILGGLAIRYAWPHEMEKKADEPIED